ncbi:MAG: Magnesium transporter MgtE [Chlamydiae bacterium]|nr:Magnesium transporter MgtE [Chlamydiota bacterium]
MRIDVSKRLSPKELSTPVEAFTTPFEFTFMIDTTIEEVLHTLQSKKVSDQVEFFYVTDHDNVLQGMIVPKDLIYSPSKATLVDIMDTDVASLSKETTLEKALKTMTHHQVLVMPVIDENNRFVGVLEVLTHDHELLYQAKKNQLQAAKEDIFQFIGLTIEQGKWNSSWLEFRYRMPWLACNLIGGLICAVIGEFYQLTLIEFVILALFIPLVLTLSESVSIQSMTLSLRFLHLRKIYWIQIWRRVVVEWKTSLLLSAACSIIIGAFYFALSVDIKPMLAISGSMFVAMIVSATFGALFPIILHLLRLDPKVAAGPLVLMMADIVTIAIYLSISTWLLI